MNPCIECTEKAKRDNVCGIEQLRNALEAFKAEIAKDFHVNYEPKFKCVIKETGAHWIYADVDTIIDCYSESEVDT